MNKQVASRESDKERSETKVKGSGEQKRPDEQHKKNFTKEFKRIHKEFTKKSLDKAQLI